MLSHRKRKGGPSRKHAIVADSVSRQQISLTQPSRPLERLHRRYHESVSSDYLKFHRIDGIMHAEAGPTFYTKINFLEKLQISSKLLKIFIL